MSRCTAASPLVVVAPQVPQGRGPSHLGLNSEGAGLPFLLVLVRLQHQYVHRPRVCNLDTWPPGSRVLIVFLSWLSQENPDEVCPAGWKPGEVTMKPDPKGKMDYFVSLSMPSG